MEIENKNKSLGVNRFWAVFGIVVLLLIGFWEYDLRSECRKDINYGPLPNNGLNNSDNQNYYKYGYIGYYNPKTYKTLSEAMKVCVPDKRAESLENLKCFVGLEC